SFDFKNDIELILEFEYGYVLDRLKDKQWKISKVNIDSVKINDYKKNVRKIVDFYKTFESDDIIILCENAGIDSDNKRVYHLIDGYHRFCAAKSNEFKKINIIHPELVI